MSIGTRAYKWLCKQYGFILHQEAQQRWVENPESQLARGINWFMNQHRKTVRQYGREGTQYFDGLEKRVLLSGSDASISGSVWQDVNGDGIRGAGEEMLPGIFVQLHDDQGQVIDSVYTDTNGDYSFDVSLGDYQVSFTTTDNDLFTLDNVGSDITIDSDVNSDGYTTTLSAVSVGQTIENIDAGMYEPDSYQLDSDVRDFHSSHPDFQNGAFYGQDVVRGLVSQTLGVDGLPDFAGNAGEYITSSTTFDQWYTDVQDVNTLVNVSMDFVETGIQSGVYQFEDYDFFPLNDDGFGVESSYADNQHFTLHAQAQFTYDPGQFISISADDDAWLYIDGQLVLDLGGAHIVRSGAVDLDALGLTAGHEYELDLFFAERYTSNSVLDVQTNVGLYQDDYVPPVQSVSGMIWEDYNGNGARDAIEPGMEGVSVFLDANGNAILDTGELTALTGADGAYQFTDVPLGSYDVYQQASTGWVLTYPEAVDGSLLDADYSTEMVNEAYDGSEANYHSERPVASNNDATIIAYSSRASNLVPDDTNGLQDIFVTNTGTGQTIRVSEASDGTQANGASNWSSISDDGRYVAFESEASNLVAGDTNGVLDIFVYDLQTEQIQRVSVASDGTQADGQSKDVMISGNGRYVSFTSSATNLVAGDTNGVADIFVYDLQTGTIERVSVDSTGSQSNGASEQSTISDDGRYVAYASTGSNLIASDLNGGTSDVFLYDRQTGQTTIVNVGENGQQGYGAYAPTLSGDGSTILFVIGQALLNADVNGEWDHYTVDLQTGEMMIPSFTVGYGSNGTARLSDDGRYVVWAAFDSQLVAGDTNNALDILVWDRQTSQIELISNGLNGAQSNNSSWNPAISDDASVVVYSSRASNLVDGDSGNNRFDIFIATFDTPTGSQASHAIELTASSYETGLLFGNQPLAYLSGATIVSEGDSFTLGLNQTDTENNPILQWDIDWGDGSAVETVAGSTSSVMHTYLDGDQAVKIQVSAVSSNDSWLVSPHQIFIQNVAPELTVGGAGTVDVGADYTLSLSSEDPGSDTINQWRIDWGDNSGYDYVDGSLDSAVHQYALAGDYTIRAYAIDEDDSSWSSYTSNELAVTVANVNNLAPISLDDTIYTDSDTTELVGNVLTNDWDFDDDQLEAILVEEASYGVVTLLPNGQYTYIPGELYSGVDSFTYVATDGVLQSDVAKVWIIDDYQQSGLLDDEYTLSHDQILDITDITDGVFGNDVRIDWSEVEIEIAEDVSNGSIVLRSDGTFAYTPHSGFVGVDSFTYSVNGVDGMALSATVTLNVVNSNPDGRSATYYLTHDSPLLIKNIEEGLFSFASDADGDFLSIYEVDGLLHGDISFNPDGTFLYTPYSQFVGLDTLIIRFSDGLGQSDEVSIVFDVSNNDPNVFDSEYFVHHDTDLVVTAENGLALLANDVDGDILSFSVSNDPIYGQLQLQEDGAFTYIPESGFVGEDSFSVYVSDGVSLQVMQVTIEVQNTAPEVNKDEYFVIHDQELNNADGVNLLANDYDLDGDEITSMLVSDVSNGVLVLNSDGTFLYTPDSGFVGVDRFVYKVSDGIDFSDDVSVEIEVTNTSPYASQDYYQVVTDSDLSVTVDDGVLVNDFDFDDDLVAAILEYPQHGAIDFDADGSFVYTPDQGYSGSDYFTYQTTDGIETTEAVRVNLSITNDSPVGENDVYDLSHNDVTIVSVEDGVLRNDSDAENSDLLEVELVDDVQHGLLVLNVDGSFVYTPDENYSGIDSFSYRIHDGLMKSAKTLVVLNVINENPVAIEDSYTVVEDATYNGSSVLDNDTDNALDVLSVELVNDVLYGDLVLESDGAFVYTPDENYFGIDSFSYVVFDGSAYSEIVQVTLDVTAVNDLPVAESFAYDIHANESYVVNGDASLVASDVDGDDLSFVLVNGPGNGVLNFNGDGTFDYTPHSDFIGQDSFTYYVSDQLGQSNVETVYINVAESEPVAQDVTMSVYGGQTTNVSSHAGLISLAYDEDTPSDVLTVSLVGDASHGQLNLNSDGSFDYTPVTGYTGSDSFTYRVSDGLTYSNTATVSLNVENSGMIANDSSYEVEHDTALDASERRGLLYNDIWDDSQACRIVEVLLPVNGTVDIDYQTGSFTYTPNAGFVGQDVLSYYITDGNQISNTAYAYFDVTNSTPINVASERTFTIEHDSELSVPVDQGLAIGIVDQNGDDITVVLDTDAAHGTVNLNSNGSFVYTPFEGFTGQDTFSVYATDGIDSSSVTTVSIQVINSSPIANSDYIYSKSGSAVSGTVLDNDFDGDSDSVTASLIAGPDQGDLMFNSDGTFTFTPDDNQAVTVSFQYQINDGVSDSSVATVVIELQNDSPVASADEYSVTHDSVLNGNVLGNDFDYDGDIITATVKILPQHGILTLNSNGDFVYEPDEQYVGSDSFEYYVTDQLVEQSAVVQIDVTNTKPVASGDYIVLEDYSAITFNILDNDLDIDSDDLSIEILSGPENGIYAFTETLGEIEYTPTDTSAESDSIVYRIFDGVSYSDPAEVAFTLPAADRMYAISDGIILDEFEDILISFETLVGNDSYVDLSHAEITVLSGPHYGSIELQVGSGFLYTPSVNGESLDSFEYQIEQNGVVSSATVTLVMPGIDMQAVNDWYSISLDETLSGVNVLDNDSISDKITDAQVSVADEPDNGQVTINSDGTFTYQPNADFSGIDGFTYTVASSGLSTTATVYISVLAEDVELLAANMNYTTLEDTYVDIPLADLLASATSLDSMPVGIQVISSPYDGTVEHLANGDIRFTPSADYFGTTSFRYQVIDENGQSSPDAILTVDVDSVADSITAQDITINVVAGEDISSTIFNYITSNDGTAIDTSNLSVTSDLGSITGVSVTSNGQINISSSQISGGTTSFSYSVTTPTGQTAVGTVHVNMVHENTAPVANSDSLTITEDTSGSINVLFNDTDADVAEGGSLNPRLVRLLSQPANGSVSLDASGNASYTPNANFAGTDSFTYMFYDSDWGASNTATVNITVENVNDAPMLNPMISSRVDQGWHLLSYEYAEDNSTYSVSIDVIDVDEGDEVEIVYAEYGSWDDYGVVDVAYDGLTVTMTINNPDDINPWMGQVIGDNYDYHTVSVIFEDQHGAQYTGSFRFEMPYWDAPINMPFIVDYQNYDYRLYIEDENVFLIYYSSDGGRISVDTTSDGIMLSAIEGHDHNVLIYDLNENMYLDGVLTGSWDGNVIWASSDSNVNIATSGNVVSAAVGSGSIDIYAGGNVSNVTGTSIGIESLWGNVTDIDGGNVNVTASGNITDIIASESIGNLTSNSGNIVNASSSGSIGSIYAGSGLSGTVSAATTIGGVTVIGSLSGTVSAGGNIGGVSARTISGTVSSGGDISGVSAIDLGGTISATGAISSITAYNTLSGTVTSGGDISSIISRLDMSGRASSTSGSIDSVSIARDFTGELHAATWLSVDVGRSISGKIESDGTIGHVHAGYDIKGQISAEDAIAAVRAGHTINSVIKSESGSITAVEAGAYSGDYHQWWTAATANGTIKGSIVADGSIGRVLAMGSPTGGGAIEGLTVTSNNGSIGIVSSSGGLEANLFAKNDIDTVSGRGDVDVVAFTYSGDIASVSSTTGSLTGLIDAGNDIGSITAFMDVDVLAYAINNIGSISSAVADVYGVAETEIGNIDSISAGYGSIDIEAKAHDSIGSVIAGFGISGSYIASVGDIDQIIAGTLLAGSSIEGEISAGRHIGIVVSNGIGAMNTSRKPNRGATPDLTDYELEQYFDSGEADITSNWIAPTASNIDRYILEGGAMDANVSAGSIGEVNVAGLIEGSISASGSIGSVWAASDIKAPISAGSGSLSVNSWGSILRSVGSGGSASIAAYGGIAPETDPIELTAGDSLSVVSWTGIDAKMIGDGLDIWSNDSVNSQQMIAGSGSINAVAWGSIHTDEAVSSNHAKFVSMGALEILESNILGAMFGWGNDAVIVPGNEPWFGNLYIATQGNVSVANGGTATAEKRINILARGDVSGKFKANEQVLISTLGNVNVEVIASNAEVVVEAINIEGKYAAQSVALNAGGDVALTQANAVDAFRIFSNGNVASTNSMTGESIEIHANGNVSGGSGGFNTTTSLTIDAWGDITGDINSSGDVQIKSFGNIVSNIDVDGFINVTTWGQYTGMSVQAGDNVSIFAAGGLTDESLSVSSGKHVYIKSFGNVNGTYQSGGGEGVDILAFGNLDGKVVSTENAIISVSGSIDAEIDAQGGYAQVEALGSVGTTIKATEHVSVYAGSVASNTTMTSSGSSVIVMSTGGIGSTTITASDDVQVVSGSSMTLNTTASSSGSVSLMALGGGITATDGVTASSGDVTATANGAVDMNVTASQNTELISFAAMKATVNAVYDAVLTSFGALEMTNVTTTIGNITAYAQGAITGAATAGAGLAVYGMNTVKGTYKANGGAASMVAYGEADLTSLEATDSVSFIGFGALKGGNVKAGSFLQVIANNITSSKLLSGSSASISATAGEISSLITTNGPTEVFAFGNITGNIKTGADGEEGEASNLTADTSVVTFADLTGNVDAGGSLSASAHGKTTKDLKAKVSIYAYANEIESGEIDAGSDALISTSGTMNANVKAGNNTSVFAKSDITGNTDATAGNATVTTLGSLSGHVKAGLATTVFSRGNISNAIKAGASADVTSMGQLTSSGLIKANLHTSAFILSDINGSISGSSVSLQTGADLNNSVTANDGGISAIVFGNATGSAVLTATADIDLLAFSNMFGSVTAGLGADVQIYGDFSNATIDAGASAGVLVRGQTSSSNISAGANASLQALSSIENSSLTAGSNATVTGMSSANNVNINASGNASALFIDDAISIHMTANDYLSLTAMSTLTNATASTNGDVSITSLGSALGVIASGDNLSISALGDVNGAQLTADSNVHFLAAGGSDATISAGGSVDAFVNGAFFSDIDALGNVSLIVMADLTGQVGAGLDMEVLSVGSMLANLDAGQDAIVTSLGRISPQSITTGGDLDAFAVGDIQIDTAVTVGDDMTLSTAARVMGLYTVGDDVEIDAYGSIESFELSAGGNIDHVYTADIFDGDIQADEYIYSLGALNGVTGTITAGKHIGSVHSYWDIDADITVTGGDPLIDWEGDIRNVSAWGSINGTITTPYTLHQVRAGEDINAAICAQTVDSTVDNDNYLTLHFPNIQPPDFSEVYANMALAQIDFAQAIEAVLDARNDIVASIARTLTSLDEQLQQSMQAFTKAVTQTNVQLDASAQDVQKQIDDDKADQKKKFDEFREQRVKQKKTVDESLATAREKATKAINDAQSKLAEDTKKLEALLINEQMAVGKMHQNQLDKHKLATDEIAQQAKLRILDWDREALKLLKARFNVIEQWMADNNLTDVIDKTQAALDVAGFIPGPIGMIADFTNATIHLIRGNYTDAALSAIAFVPLAGDAVAGVYKSGKRLAGKSLATAGDFHKIIRTSKNAAELKSNLKAYLKCNQFWGHCFLAGTYVLTDAQEGDASAMLASSDTPANQTADGWSLGQALAGVAIGGAVAYYAYQQSDRKKRKYKLSEVHSDRHSGNHSNWLEALETSNCRLSLVHE